MFRKGRFELLRKESGEIIHNCSSIDKTRLYIDNIISLTTI
jgi:hypothetical protein